MGLFGALSRAERPRRWNTRRREGGTVDHRARRNCLVKGLPRDRKRRDPTIRVSVRGTPLRAGVLLSTKPRTAGDGRQEGVSSPRRVYIRKDVEIQKYGQTPRCQGCLAVATEESISHNSERLKRVDSAMCDDAAVEQMSGAAKCNARGTRRTAEAGLPSLQDFAWSRPLQSHGEMREGEQSCETSEAVRQVAFSTPFCFSRQANWLKSRRTRTSQVGRHWRSESQWDRQLT